MRLTNSVSAKNRPRSYWHTRVFGYLLQFFGKKPQVLIRAMFLMRKTSNGPNVDFNPSMKLFSRISQTPWLGVALENNKYIYILKKIKFNFESLFSTLYCIFLLNLNLNRRLIQTPVLNSRCG